MRTIRIVNILSPSLVTPEKLIFQKVWNVDWAMQKFNALKVTRELIALSRADAMAQREEIHRFFDWPLPCLALRTARLCQCLVSGKQFE